MLRGTLMVLFNCIYFSINEVQPGLVIKTLPGYASKQSSFFFNPVFTVTVFYVSALDYAIS